MRHRDQRGPFLVFARLRYNPPEFLLQKTAPLVVAAQEHSTSALRSHGCLIGMAAFVLPRAAIVPRAESRPRTDLLHRGKGRYIAAVSAKIAAPLSLR